MCSCRSTIHSLAPSTRSRLASPIRYRSSERLNVYRTWTPWTLEISVRSSPRLGEASMRSGNPRWNGRHPSRAERRWPTIDDQNPAGPSAWLVDVQPRRRRSNVDGSAIPSSSITPPPGPSSIARPGVSERTRPQTTTARAWHPSTSPNAALPRSAIASSRRPETRSDGPKKSYSPRTKWRAPAKAIGSAKSSARATGSVQPSGRVPDTQGGSTRSRGRVSGAAHPQRRSARASVRTPVGPG